MVSCSLGEAFGEMMLEIYLLADKRLCTSMNDRSSSLGAELGL